MACACGCSRQQFGSACSCRTMGVRLLHLVQLPLAPVGELRGLIYRASRAPGEPPRNYVHFFQRRPPLLVADPTGTQLYIVGGQYRVTGRGIEG